MIEDAPPFNHHHPQLGARTQVLKLSPPQEAMSEELKTSFLGALQASISVLLVIFYGVLAAQFDLLKDSTTKQISTLCVRMFLPALLVTNVGSQLHADTGLRYVPIVIWGLFYALSSMLLGWVLTRVFKLPSWTTPAVSFNNTTALPLLLIGSLKSTGILDSLLMSDADTPSDALLRAKSYFLVNAMIGDSLTFAMGPKLLDGEETPDKLFPQAQSDDQGEQRGGTGNGHVEETARISNRDDEAATEQTSLLPSFVVRGEEAAGRFSAEEGQKGWSHLPVWAQRFLHFAYAFVHAPLLGAASGAIIGLVPALHRAFFGDPRDGGIFRAWLTDSVQKIGDLFPALQVVVVGVKLSSSMRKMKRGEDSGNVPWVPMVFVTVIRFVVWPAISISLIYLLASKTSLLDEDPMLWFTMMIMPTGPTAMKLTALADVSGSGEAEKMSIAKFLSITYVLSPLICFTVVAALKACHAAGDVS